MISFNLPRTLRDEEEGIDTPLARQGPELVHGPRSARIRSRNGPFPPDTLPAFLPLRAAAPLTSPHDGPLRWNASGGLRRCSSGNGSGRTRPRRGFRWWFSCATRPSGPAPVEAVVLALGKGLMQQDHLRRPPNSRTGQVRASVRPPAPRRPGRNRTVSPSRHNAPRSQGPRGGRNRSVGGASSLGETTVYSPSSKCPLRLYARCPMQRVMFLAFVAGGLVNPAIDVAQGWP